jgi:hypothetical protein
MLRYIPLISFLWKLVLKLKFISSRSPLFLPFIAVTPTTYWIQTMRLLLYLSHASIKRKLPTYGGTLLGSSFVKPATEHSSCLLALHMFGNHLYMCADWWHCYIQSLGLDEHPLDKSLLVDVRERIATFLMERVITTGGKFYADDTVGSDYVWLIGNFCIPPCSWIFAFLLVHEFLWYCCISSLCEMMMLNFIIWCMWNVDFCEFGCWI